MSLFGSIDLNGKKISLQRYDELMEKSTNNVILSGFHNEETLTQAIQINSYGNKQMAARLMIKLLGIYQKQIEDESIGMFSETTPCYNILEISKKMKMLYNVLDQMVNAQLEDFRKGGTRKMALLEAKEGLTTLESSEEDNVEEDEEFYYDDDVEEDEEEVKKLGKPGSSELNLDVAALLNAATRKQQQG